MTELITRPNIANPDNFYAKLLALHEGCDKETSDAINAKLILILTNHIGDEVILDQAFELASR